MYSNAQWSDRNALINCWLNQPEPHQSIHESVSVAFMLPSRNARRSIALQWEIAYVYIRWIIHTWLDILCNYLAEAIATSLCPASRGTSVSRILSRHGRILAEKETRLAFEGSVARWPEAAAAVSHNFLQKIYMIVFNSYWRIWIDISWLKSKFVEEVIIICLIFFQ